MFSAVAAGCSKGKSKGATVVQLQEDIIRLSGGTWPAAAPGKTTMKKAALLKLYMQMTETICDDTSKPIRAAAEKEAGVESIQVDPHKTTDTFDYHGNFDSKRFELWFEKLCKLAFFECAGRDFNEKDEQRYENGLTTFDCAAHVQIARALLQRRCAASCSPVVQSSSRTLPYSGTLPPSSERPPWSATAPC